MLRWRFINLQLSVFEMKILKIDVDHISTFYFIFLKKFNLYTYFIPLNQIHLKVLLSAQSPLILLPRRMDLDTHIRIDQHTES